MIRPSGFSDKMAQFKPGDLITFIEGQSWVFVTKYGEGMRTPPLGIVLSVFDEIGIRVFLRFKSTQLIVQDQESL